MRIVAVFLLVLLLCSAPVLAGSQQAAGGSDTDSSSQNAIMAQTSWFGWVQVWLFDLLGLDEVDGGGDSDEPPVEDSGPQAPQIDAHDSGGDPPVK